MIELTEKKDITRCQLIIWYLMGTMYLTSLVLNIFSQTAHTWGKYAFELTQVGAWLALSQHLLHPYSPIKPFLLKPFDNCQSWHGKWKCIRRDSYTHRVGLSNLVVIVEILIPTLYWALAFQFMSINTTKGYVNSIFMHGVISLTLLLDYLFHQRPFHLRHTMMNLSIFIPIYIGWNYIGQKAQSEPIYPMIDWEKKPLNGLLVLAIGFVGGLLASIALKGILHLCEKKCRPKTASTIYTSSQATTPVVLNTPYVSLEEVP